jgi:Zn-finger protein
MSKPPPKKKKACAKKDPPSSSAFGIYPGLIPWLSTNNQANKAPNVLSPSPVKEKKKNISVAVRAKKTMSHRKLPTKLFIPIKESASTSKEADESTIIDLCSDDSHHVIDLTGIPDEDAAVARLEVVDRKPPPKKTRIVRGDTIYDESMYGTPVKIIMDNHPLFYTYDPRGVKRGEDLPPAHCRRCRCPLNYCAETVFGAMIEKRCDYEIYKRLGVHVFHDEYEIQMIFERFYTEAVVAKLMWNDIDFSLDHNNALKRLYIPSCMKRRSFKRVMKDYKLEKERLDSIMYDDVVEEPYVAETDVKVSNMKL